MPRESDMPEMSPMASLLPRRPANAGLRLDAWRKVAGVRTARERLVGPVVLEHRRLQRHGPGVVEREGEPVEHNRAPFVRRRVVGVKSLVGLAFDPAHECGHTRASTSSTPGTQTAYRGRTPGNATPRCEAQTCMHTRRHGTLAHLFAQIRGVASSNRPHGAHPASLHVEWELSTAAQLAALGSLAELATLVSFVTSVHWRMQFRESPA